MAGTSRVLAQKLRRFLKFSKDELAFLAELEAEHTYKVASGTELISEGLPRQHCFIVQEGWAACYKLLEDGRRQIINFPVTGDFIGLRSLLLRVADHAAVAVSEVTVSRLPRQRIINLIEDMPRLGAAVLWALCRDEAIVVEHLVNVGRRSPLERTAHLFLELDARLQSVGRASDDGFACPLTQEELGDALGLSTIHVNRVLRQLRERGLLTLAQRRLVIHDAEGLRGLAGFSATYLDHDGGDSGSVAAT